MKIVSGSGVTLINEDMCCLLLGCIFASCQVCYAASGMCSNGNDKDVLLECLLHLLP